MSILSNKDIQAFAKMINNSSQQTKQSYSIAGTVVEELEDDEVYVDDINTTNVKSVSVLLDGGTEDNLCIAQCNNIVCAVNDRVVVTIEDGVATVTENYTNPNGNTIHIREHTTGEYVFESIANISVFSKLIISETLEVDSGYTIIGLKSIKIEILNLQSGKWSDMYDSYIGGIHLTSWNFNGQTITVQIGRHAIDTGEPSVASGTYHFRLKIIYVSILSTEATEEENNG